MNKCGDCSKVLILTNNPYLISHDVKGA